MQVTLAHLLKTTPQKITKEIFSKLKSLQVTRTSSNNWSTTTRII